MGYNKLFFFNQNPTKSKFYFASSETEKSFKSARDGVYCPIKQIGLPLRGRQNHSYDYRPNWTPLSPVTITNKNDKIR